MKKYLGIVRKATESMVGLDIRILTKFSDRKQDLQQWIKLYPGSESIIMDNTEQLEHFFECFEDFTPMTADEKQNAQKLYQELMQEND